MKKNVKKPKRKGLTKKYRIPLESMRECNIINLTFERVLAKKPDIYFSGHKEPDYTRPKSRNLG